MSDYGYGNNCWDCGEPLTRDEVIAGGNCVACYEESRQRVAIKTAKERMAERKDNRPVLRGQKPREKS